MELGEKKINKLSMISLILLVSAPLLFIGLKKLLFYMDIESGVEFVFITLYIPFILSIIFAIVSLFKIKKYNQKGKGFAVGTIVLLTIIILYVFSSYIGLGNPPGRPKSSNDSVRSMLASMRGQAEIYYYDKKSYENICTDTTGFGALLSNANEYSNKEVKCFSDNDSFVVSAELKDKPKENDKFYGYDYFCVDYTGVAKNITPSQDDTIINSETICPE